ncbi:MAG: hypothetical protein RLZZ502_752 [Pseudomonadota bacterium]|jgi:DNA-binding response OmpR family regulator
MKFLIIEDDATLRQMMALSLQAAGHKVDIAAHASEADTLWRTQTYDAIALDLNLPADGRSPQTTNALGLLRRARQQGNKTPVLVVTARNRVDERIEGLEAGADDYLGKPFDLAELEVRLRVLMRRAQLGSEQEQIGGLRLHRTENRFYLDTVVFDLPAREHEVLFELMNKPGKVVSKKTLADKLSTWDEYLGDNALEAFVSRLRKKLAGSGARIRTLRGLGYVLEVETDSAPT